MRKITAYELILKLENLPPNTELEVLTRCKACYWIGDENLVRFYRVDLYEKRKKLKKGYQCEACGYLNAEEDEVKTK